MRRLYRAHNLREALEDSRDRYRTRFARELPAG